MKKALLAVLLLVLFVPASYGSVLTFDDLGDYTSLGSYGGFTWANFLSQTYSTYDSVYGNTLTPTSAPTHIYNGDGNPAASFGSTFFFLGASLGAWTLNNAAWSFNADSVTIVGFLAGAPVASYVADLDPYLGSMHYFETGWTGPVDAVVFVPNSSAKLFLLDDFTFAVPEPASLSLLGLGLMALVIKSRKRKPSSF